MKKRFVESLITINYPILWGGKDAIGVKLKPKHIPVSLVFAYGIDGQDSIYLTRKSPVQNPHLISTLFALASRREGGDFRDSLKIEGCTKHTYILRIISTVVFRVENHPKTRSHRDIIV